MNKHGYKRNRIPKHIKEWIGYNEEGGFLYWKKAKGIAVKEGQEITRVMANDGSCKVTFEGKLYRQSRVVVYIVKGVQPLYVRFRDGDRTNMRIDNLQCLVN